jgi:hypothetical protein
MSPLVLAALLGHEDDQQRMQPFLCRTFWATRFGDDSHLPAREKCEKGLVGRECLIMRRGGLVILFSKGFQPKTDPGSFFATLRPFYTMNLWQVVLPVFDPLDRRRDFSAKVLKPSPSSPQVGLHRSIALQYRPPSECPSW